MDRIKNGVHQVITLLSHGNYSMAEATEVLHQANKKIGDMATPTPPTTDSEQSEREQRRRR